MALLGFTHTQYSLEQAGPAAQGARASLSRRPLIQAQAIMGWGADNPQPRQGEFNWASLDAHIELIRATNGTPVITLCCAPDWMKGGAPGQTDWSRLELAPDPRYFDDFAELAAQVARRYPDVKYYLVWNELKGFWSQAANRWDYEGYTQLYNKVYESLKRVSSDIRVGGPYMVMDSAAPGHDDRRSPVQGPWGSLDSRAVDVVTYWFKNKRSTDFAVVDGASMSEDRNTGLNEFQALDKFSAITRWLHGLDARLPVWWAEWYVEPDGSG
jgi:hypothetical protein